MLDIREYLKTHRIIMDGAMGTYYSKITNSDTEFAEYANITHPDIIEKIHKNYIDAGAVIIRTNTFAAGTQALNISKEEQTELIETSCRIALNTAKDRAYVAGNIGPLRENAETSEEELINEYKHMCDIFIKENVDLLLFETFPDLTYLRQIVNYIKSKKDIFIMTNFCLNKNGYTWSGLSASKLLKEISDIDEIDACGFNCGIGSGHMYNIMKKIHFPANKYIACLPNAGYPEQMQNRLVFMDNVDYFSDNMKRISELGIDVIGGCCGTTPEYIKSLTSQITLEPVKKSLFVTDTNSTIKKELHKNDFYEKFKSGKKVIAVELDPPFGADYEKLVQYAQILKKQKVDVITMADSPMGRSRVDSILMGIKLAAETGITVMPHVCCRDKNMIAIRSTLLGAYINNIRNLLLVTGDPVPSESRISTTGVFDYNSIKLMNFVKEMNEQHFYEEPLYYGGALNCTLGKLNSIVERMNKKVEAGCKYFMTQPVYSDETIERLRQIKQQVDSKILCGIMPLVSYRNANFIKNEFIGIDVPQSILDKYSPEMTKNEGEEAGIEVARSIIEKTASFVDGYYFMLPFNRVHLIEKILS